MNNFTEETNLLKSFGFRVFINKNPNSQTYAIFEKDGKLGMLEREFGGGYKFSTKHKPCRECGTGFIICSGSLTKENAEKAFGFAPDWAYQSQLNAIKKWSGIEEYIAKNDWFKSLIEVL